MHLQLKPHHFWSVILQTQPQMILAHKNYILEHRNPPKKILELWIHLFTFWSKCTDMAFLPSPSYINKVHTKNTINYVFCIFSSWRNFVFVVLSFLLWSTVGLIVTTLALILFTFFFGLAPLLVAEATALIPGNEKFQKRIEYANVIDYYFSKRWYYLFQLMLAGNLLFSNLTSIRVSSQVSFLARFVILFFLCIFSKELNPTRLFFVFCILSCFVVDCGQFDSIYFW